MEIKDILKIRRLELGLTMLDVANAVGVSEATVSRWESGNIANMKRSRIAALAKVLQVNPSVIMGWSDDPNSVIDSTQKEKNALEALSNSRDNYMRNSQELAICIKELAKSKNITIGKMLSDCGLSIDALSCMQSRGYYPRLEALVRIADYLDCSVDYLLGRVDYPELVIKKAPLDGGADEQYAIHKDVPDLTPEEIAKLRNFLDNYEQEE